MKENNINLPNEIILLVFSFFKKPVELARLKLVCNNWKNLVEKTTVEQKIAAYVEQYKKSNQTKKEQGLVSATQNGELFKIYALQKLGMSIHFQCLPELGLGDTLLHIAVRKKQALVVEYLLERKVDTHIVNAGGKTARQLAKDIGFEAGVQAIDSYNNYMDRKIRTSF